MHKCPKCGTEFEGNFCPECGEKFVEEKTCPSCGKTLAGGTKFCPDCGYSFYEKPAPAQTAPAPAQASAPTHVQTTPAPKPARQLTSGTQKLYSFVSLFPTALFVVLSAVLLLFFLAPVAIMPGGEFFGASIPSESYGNVYEIANYDGLSLTGSLTTLIVFASFSLFVVLLLGILPLFSKLRYLRVTLFGKSVFLRNVLTAVGYLLFFVLFLISCILLGQISSEDGGFGIFTAGAAPILILVFTLIGCLIAVGCAIGGKYLRSAYPALVTAQEKKIAAAKPTKFESWVKSHKKLTAVLSSVLVVAIIVGVAVPVSIANRHNGVYYAYNGETEEYNTERFFKLSGGTWQDESGNKGKIEFDGETVTLSYDRSNGTDKTGMSTMEIEGTLIDDVLKIGGTVFAKEGHEHNMINRECACGIKDNSSEGLAFEKVDDHWIVSKGTCIETDIVISAWHEDGPVTSIGDYAFSHCSELTSITIPDSVTELGSYAFYGCDKLTSITIPNSVASIGYCAFSGCSGLTSIEIPDSVTSIGERAFGYCSGLESISVALGNKVYKSEQNCLIEKQSNTLIAGCKTSVIPNDVTSIGDFAFSGCSGLTSIEIPDNVTSIKDGAFSDCSELTSIEIPNSVTSIGMWAFGDCSGLTSITIPNSVASIGYDAFEGCTSLSSITIPDSVTEIGGNAFDGTAYYNDASHWDASDVLYIGNHLIEAKDTISGAYTIREGTKTIGDSAFSGCSGLTGELKIPDSVTSIGMWAFRDCSGLTSIEIPDGVTKIGDHAFSNCSGLTSVTIGGGVTSIGSWAFSYCSGLTDIQFKGTVKAWQAIKKSWSWDGGTGDYTVTCTDGTVTWDGTVTYFNA